MSQVGNPMIFGGPARTLPSTVEAYTNVILWRSPVTLMPYCHYKLHLLLTVWLAVAHLGYGSDQALIPGRSLDKQLILFGSDTVRYTKYNRCTYGRPDLILG